jgi:hypothetical protein
MSAHVREVVLHRFLGLFVLSVEGLTGLFYLCEPSQFDLFFLDLLFFLTVKTVQLASGNLCQQQQQCAALCPTRATWKLEFSKTMCLHGSRASTTTYAISSGSLSLGLFTSLQQHHQGRLPSAFSQVQSRNPSPDMGYDQKALLRPHQCLSMETCQAYFFPHGAVHLAVLLQSMSPQSDIQM